MNPERPRKTTRCVDKSNKRKAVVDAKKKAAILPFESRKENLSVLSRYTTLHRLNEHGNIEIRIL